MYRSSFSETSQHSSTTVSTIQIRAFKILIIQEKDASRHDHGNPSHKNSGWNNLGQVKSMTPKIYLCPPAHAIGLHELQPGSSIAMSQTAHLVHHDGRWFENHVRYNLDIPARKGGKIHPLESAAESYILLLNAMACPGDRLGRFFESQVVNSWLRQEC